MAKKHKNLENIKIRWDGVLSKPSDGSAQSSPDSVDLGIWGGRVIRDTHVPVWEASGCAADDTSKCASGVMDDPVYFEDYNIWCFNPSAGYSYTMDCQDTELDVVDGVIWGLLGRNDIKDEVNAFLAGDMPDNAPVRIVEPTYTWGDVGFVIEIADGIGTGNRRAREARLNQFEQEKKKRLIRLICRVKGEKVYDEEKEVGDTYIKLEDADLVINEVLGKIKVENTNVL